MLLLDSVIIIAKYFQVKESTEEAAEMFTKALLSRFL